MNHAYRVIASLLLAAVAVAARSSQPSTSSDEKKTASANPVTDQDRVQWYQDCWNNFNMHKWDDFRKCYADNATSQQGGYGAAEVTGADNIIASSKDFAKSFPDGAGEPQLILVNGNKIASLYILKGTNSGPLTGPDKKEMPATNKKFGVLFGHYIEAGPPATSENAQDAIRSLRVVKEFGVMDGGTMAVQLGLSKNPARPVMDKGEAMAKVVIAKNDENEMKNVEADKAQLEAFNKRDFATSDSFAADDIVFHDMTGPKDTGKKENSDMNKQFATAFPDAKITPTSVWGAGDYVAVVGTFEGTNNGDFPAMQLKKTGKKVSIPFFGIDRFEGGKQKESWFIFDTASFMSQLGIK